MPALATVPDSPTALAAADLARAAASPFLLNHAYRTYVFGAAVVTQDVDHDAAFVAAMIHDLGLTDQHRGDEEFAEISADLASRFLESQGWETDRIRLVETAIVRHTLLDPGGDPTIRLVQTGARIDVVGHAHGEVDDDVVRAVLAVYPRLDFVDRMRAIYLQEIDRHPGGAFADLERTFALSTRFAANPIDHLG